MCSHQMAFFAHINAQLSLVRELVEDLKYDLGSNAKIKRVCPHVLGMVAHAEFILSQIESFDGDSLEDCEVPDDWEKKFMKRTYSEIVHIDQTDDEVSCSESFMVVEEKSPEEQFSSLIKAQSTVRGPYRSYNTIEKLNVVRLHREGKSYASISKLLKIPQKNIVRWCKNGIYRKEGAGRKIGDESMEKKVVEWIQKQYLYGKHVTGKDIRNKAMEYSTKTEFKSSKGWLKNFMKRQQDLAKYVKL